MSHFPWLSSTSRGYTVYVCKTPLRSPTGGTAKKVPSGKPMLAAPWRNVPFRFIMAEREPMFDVWDIWLEI